MKIQLLEEPVKTAKPIFRDIRIGDVFLFSGRHYIKTSHACFEGFNSFCIPLNSLAHIDTIAEVEPKNFILQEVANP